MGYLDLHPPYIGTSAALNLRLALVVLVIFVIFVLFVIFVTRPVLRLPPLLFGFVFLPIKPIEIGLVPGFIRSDQIGMTLKGPFEVVRGALQNRIKPLRIYM